LASALITNNVSWDRKAVNKKILSISDWGLKKLLQVLVAFLILISLLSPLGDKFAMEDKNVEKGVQEKNDIILDGNAIEKDGLWRDVESIRHKSWLNHNQRVVDILLVEYMPIESGLIRTVVEYLQKLTSSQMEHELGVNAKVISQSETPGILFSIIRKLLAETYQHSVKPSKDVGGIINLGFEDRYSCHQDSRGLLIE